MGGLSHATLMTTLEMTPLRVATDPIWTIFYYRRFPENASISVFSGPSPAGLGSIVHLAAPALLPTPPPYCFACPSPPTPFHDFAPISSSLIRWFPLEVAPHWSNSDPPPADWSIPPPRSAFWFGPKIFEGCNKFGRQSRDVSGSSGM
jgi:hypothetical protein